jgi:short-subunit dehydrogenase
MPMLRKAGEEHRKALILNMASIAGKSGQPWLSIYGATKAAVLNFSVATEREVGKEGIACTAFAPAFVDTAMTDFVKGAVPAEEMIRPSDIGEGVRFLLNLSPNCHIPEIVFTRGGESDGAP